METIMEEVNAIMESATDRQTVRKHLGGPTGRRLNSTSTIMVENTLTHPNNELIILAVAEKLFGYMKIPTVVETRDNTPSKKVKSTASRESSENQPPTAIPVDSESFEAPSVEQIARYIRQIFKTALCSVDCTIVCLIYIERLMKVSGLQLTPKNWRSLIAIGMLLASKVHDDLSMVNADFAVFLPFGVDQINNWERQFLAGIKYDVRVSASQYTQYYFDLREKMLKEMGGEISSIGPEALDVQHAERLQVLSSIFQRRTDEMRTQKRVTNLRRAVSDQYVPSTSSISQADSLLPAAPDLAHSGHAHAGNFIVD